MSRRLVIPRRLTVKGRRWTVRSTTKLPWRWCGECDSEKREIVLNAGDSRLERERTLVHEVLHAVFPQGVVNDATEEKIVDAMERPLHAILVSGALVSAPEEVR